MTVAELAEALHLSAYALPEPEREVSGAYAGDLLSWVMAHGKQGMAWITVQTHMNVIAVASLMEMAAVIIPEGIQMEEPSLEKAREEGVAVLQSDKTAFALCALLAQHGLPSSQPGD